MKHWLRPSQRSVGWGLLCIYVLLLVVPILAVIVSGFRGHDGTFTLRYFAIVLTDPSTHQGLLKAFLIAAATTTLATVIALPLAALSSRYDFTGRQLLLALCLLPMVLPPFVGAVGMRLVFARYGTLTQWFAPHAPLGVDWLGQMREMGVVSIEALSLFPIILLNVQAALGRVDPTQQRAAANLGASPWSVFRRVTLPQVRPGLFAGCTLVAVWSFTELGTPLMFAVYDVTPVQIFFKISEPDNPIAHALVVLLLVVAAVLFFIGKFLLGRPKPSLASKASAQPTLIRLHGLKGLAASVPFLLVLSLALVPHFAVLLTALSDVGHWYRSALPTSLTLAHFAAAWSDEMIAPTWIAGRFTLGAIGNSILYATLASAVGLCLALGSAWLIVRSKLWLRHWLDALGMLPMAVPGLVLAFGYLAIGVGIKRALGDATPTVLDVQQFPVLFLVLAYAIRRLPYTLRSAVAGLEQTPVSLELAARNLGAGATTTVRKITLPLISAHLFAGVLMAFTFALLEVSDSLVLAQKNEFYPLTRAIWELSQRLGDGAHLAAALGVWAMCLLGLALVAASIFLGQRLGGLFKL